MKGIILGLTALHFGLLAHTVAAANFEVLGVEELQYPQYGLPNRLLIIEMTGDVTAGDTSALREILDQHNFDPWIEFDEIVLTLNSSGGSLAEAIKMMDLLRDRIVQTYVDEDAVCLSACAMIFMNGTTASVDSKRQSRTLRPGGTVGFHAPSLGLTGTTSVPLAELNTAYAAALATMSEVIGRSAHLGLPDSLIVDMLATPPDQMRIVETVSDANRWGITIEAMAMKRPMSDADIIQACLLQKYYDAGNTNAHLENSLNEMANGPGVQYLQIELHGEPREVAVLQINYFTGESCGILGFQGGGGQIVYSFGDAGSIAQTLQTSSWTSNVVTQQSALDPRLEITALPAKLRFRKTELSCPYAFTTVDENHDAVCLAPDAN